MAQVWAKRTAGTERKEQGKVRKLSKMKAAKWSC
jgi:hypothetical protein